MSFQEYLINNRIHRRFFCLLAIIIIVQLSVFKYIYPYASFIHGDSFSYILATARNLNINTYPIGYSKFLRLFSVFTSSDTVLVTFQYLSIQLSGIFLLSTIFYFYRPHYAVQITLITLQAINPLFLHLANLISSDALFLALSLLWLSSLIWIINKPSNKILFYHTVAIFLLFTIRYNGILYPFISILLIIVSKASKNQKFVCIALCLLTCGSFVLFTSYQYKVLTGKWQYSPFSGWQLSNNAMYAYRYVDSSERRPVPQKFQALNNMITEYFDSTRDLKKFPEESVMASTYYMWSPSMPLFRYRNKIFENDKKARELKKWATVAPLYKEYGIHIITEYPFHFTKYFLLPNTCKYFAPPVEFLETYNSGLNIVTPETKSWFNYKSTTVWTRSKNTRIWILDIFPIFSGVINVVMLCSLAFFTSLQGWKLNLKVSSFIFITGLFWVVNACFTIFASSVALRFQAFPITITSISVCIQIESLIHLLKDSNTYYRRISGPTKEIANNFQ